MPRMLGGVPKAVRDDVGALAGGMALDSDTRRKAGRDAANSNSNSKAERMLASPTLLHCDNETNLMRSTRFHFEFCAGLHDGSGGVESAFVYRAAEPNIGWANVNDASVISRSKMFRTTTGLLSRRLLRPLLLVLVR